MKKLNNNDGNAHKDFPFFHTSVSLTSKNCQITKYTYIPSQQSHEAQRTSTLQQQTQPNS